MVQEETRRQLSDADIIDFIKANQKHINKLAKKFFYFTYLNSADLVQEGKLKIITILRKWERGDIDVPKEDLPKYVGKSLVRHYIWLVREFPADTFYDPVILDYTLGRNRECPQDITDDVIHYLILQDELNEQELQVAFYYLCDFKREHIAKFLNLSVYRIDKIRQQMQEKLRDKF